MERMRIIINFKNTPEEIELYKNLKKHSSVSGYIKDILKGIITINNVKNESEIDDIYDDITDIIED
ncbi:hypothetical protein [Clostridium sp.]|jgi:hypothetical protein|uniref:hypothetical protein n=1 Tax=Clostridium sp. TaxID=1506 RepID=UPI0025B92776|nr:hypothetical protein [Clostridium sp.]MCI9069884.1 hypothetical protein [Clostridium sp.]